MRHADGWVALAKFGARWEADILLGALRAARIPAIVAGGRAGAFGRGFVPEPARGVVVRVPREFEERARELHQALGGFPGDDDPPPGN